jgi:uncharacterized protein YfaP (DUF2135 family)
MTTRYAILAIAALACGGPRSCAAASEPGSEAARIDLDTPRGGWRHGSGEGSNFTQEVRYPAVAVSTPGDQSDAARIRGHIQATASEKPALLVVNGVAMPLKVGDDGGFDRPYLFPAGSNSIEVRDGERTATRRVQFHSDGTGQSQARLRVLLAWDSDGTDLDLHVVTPDGEHTFYGNRVVPNGGALDVDVTSGYGPEIFATPTPLTGSYLVYVNYYGGAQEDAITTASVTIITQEGTANERQQTVLVPMRGAGELTLVKRFSYP